MPGYGQLYTIGESGDRLAWACPRLEIRALSYGCVVRSDRWALLNCVYIGLIGYVKWFKCCNLDQLIQCVCTQ